MLQRFSIKKINLHLGIYIYTYVYIFFLNKIHHAICNVRSMIFCLNTFLLLFKKKQNTRFKVLFLFTILHDDAYYRTLNRTYYYNNIIAWRIVWTSRGWFYYECLQRKIYKQFYALWCTHILFAYYTTRALLHNVLL